MTINEIIHEIPHMRYRLESTKHKETLDEIEEVLRHHKEINEERNEMIDIVHEIIEMDKWIPMTTRPMTEEEREHPNVINGSRRKRIAAGSGTTVEEVNRLLKQYDHRHLVI